MKLDPGQPVFVKEVSGNVWKTAIVDQPAAVLPIILPIIYP